MNRVCSRGLLERVAQLSSRSERHNSSHARERVERECSEDPVPEGRHNETMTLVSPRRGWVVLSGSHPRAVARG